MVSVQRVGIRIWDIRRSRFQFDKDADIWDL